MACSDAKIRANLNQHRIETDPKTSAGITAKELLLPHMNTVPTTPGRQPDGSQIELKSVEKAGSHIIGHPHGLSSKKRLAPRNSSPLPRNGNSTLDRIDVNKLFEEGNGLVKMNHSPIKIELSSPAKLEEMDDCRGPEPKKLKLELALAPNLSQPYHGIETIEMIERKTSPQREPNQDTFELEEAIKESKEDRDSMVDSPNSNGRSDDILELHRLTPVYNDSQMEGKSRDHNSDREVFNIISRRNEELVDQIQVLNRSINGVINNCDSAVGKYRREIETLKHDYEAKLDGKVEEMTSVAQECKTLQERMHMLKRRLDETRDEVKMLSQNQSILKNKYESATKETEKFQKSLSELEEIHLKLKSEAIASSKRFAILGSDHEVALGHVKELEEDKKALIEVKRTSEERVKSLNQELEAKQEELGTLRSQLKENLAAQQGSTDEKIRQVEVLARAKEDLEILQRESIREKENLQSRIVAFERELKTTNGLVATHQQNEDILRRELEARTLESQNWQKNYETVNDDVEIREAEVKELYSDLEEHKELKLHLETSITQLEEQVNDWRRKCDEHCSNYEKIALELESVHLKNSNIEAEHLAELEQLHDNLSSLQNTLRKDSELISQLTRKNETLEGENRNLQGSHPQPPGLAELKNEVEVWKQKYHSKELESNKSLKLLAEDLYIQYSSKHEQKVKLLKKGYETKFQGKLDRLSLQNEGLTQEVDQVKAQLATERKEKQKLISLLESHVSPSRE